MTADLLLTHTVPGGAAWSLQISRGRTVTFTAEADRANVSLLLFAAAHRTDRLNVPDTLKAQYSACIKAPMVLMSDRGIGLASVTGSSLPWHDALCGHGLSGYGASSYGTDRNEWRRSARTGLLSELRKHGRSEADLHATVNLFSKAALDDVGRAVLRARPLPRGRLGDPAQRGRPAARALDGAAPARPGLAAIRRDRQRRYRRPGGRR